MRRKRKLDEKGSRIEQENSDENEQGDEESDESNLMQRDGSDDDDLPEFHLRPNAPEMETCGADDDAMETGEQDENETASRTRNRSRANHN